VRPIKIPCTTINTFTIIYKYNTIKKSQLLRCEYSIENFSVRRELRCLFRGITVAIETVTFDVVHLLCTVTNKKHTQQYNGKVCHFIVFPVI
jgi:diacylglycerol kinase family enzyme